MPLKTKENYLKSMYLIEEHVGTIAASELGKRLGVSVPTVNSMVKRLQDEGWVVYQKYKPIKLTNLGRKEAALIIRKHRIVEMFLVEKLNFGWEEVHEIAEEMEHIHSEALFERMDEVLGNPVFDPHGSPIPDRQGKIHLRHSLKLSEMKVGDKVKLRALLHSNSDFLMYLNNKKLELGAEITITHIESFDGSMTISYGEETSVTLSREVCERLFVEQLNV
ncbi:iron (metal) dependent repressor, DtxR family [Mariniphaga anaerophila]|uniref:Transcriptional regulator MntR n=1 Tax=Mariniphaga anaerophila TaxID=1484053 RepID=A0A1M4WN30_9BACT|nr:metal-dependent transcriptional regulator [Mariniphaga anaerophila]SHE82659.1 iron (metal) dependent repressor, DtxR family [Mariniphaga anaerophila]